jgi:site-specific recombinase XerD
MLLSAAITALLTATRADGRSQHTVTGYRDALASLQAFLGDREVQSITLTDLRGYAAHLRDQEARYAGHPNRPAVKGGLSVFSIANRLRSVKRLFAWLSEENALADNPARRLKLPRLPQKEPKSISIAAFEQLLAATAGDSVVKRRDRALLLVLADTGCRVGGLVGLRVQDVDLVRGVAIVTEKGEKRRQVYFSPPTADALQRWLAVRPAVAGDWLFPNLGPRQTHPQLTEDAVGEVLRRLRHIAGVTEPVTPHRFRHAFAREYLRSGGDLATLSRILGHSSVEVTARYYAVFTPSELQEFHGKHSPVARLERRQKGQNEAKTP